jgi:hypothetical protein
MFNFFFSIQPANRFQTSLKNKPGESLINYFKIYCYGLRLRDFFILLNQLSLNSIVLQLLGSCWKSSKVGFNHKNNCFNRSVNRYQNNKCLTNNNCNFIPTE